MWNRSPRPLCALAWFAGLACALHSQPARVLWKGSSGEFTIESSTSNLRATRTATGATVFDASAMARADWKGIIADSTPGRLEGVYTYRLLSVVGPYLSFEESEGCDCGGAHPSAMTRIRAIDLSRSTPAAPAAALLSSVIPERDILAALLSDPVVRKAMGPDKRPVSVAALVKELQSHTVTVAECDYIFPRDLLEDFAFYDSQGGKVLVRLSLPYAAEVCRGKMTQLGLALPAPEAMRPWLADAKTGHGGLLMLQSKRISPSLETSLSFTRK